MGEPLVLRAQHPAAALVFAFFVGGCCCCCDGGGYCRQSCSCRGFRSVIGDPLERYHMKLSMRLDGGLSQQHVAAFETKAVVAASRWDDS